MWAAAPSATSLPWRIAATAVSGRNRVARFASSSPSAAASSKAKVAAVSRVRGTRDLLADDAEQHQRVLQVLQQTVGCYGFRPVRICILLLW